MDTHPIQVSSQRWMVAICLLLLVAVVQGLFLWNYADEGLWVALTDGVISTAVFAGLAYWAWYVLGFVNSSIITLSVSGLGVCCIMLSSFFTQWGLETVTETVYTPFAMTFPFRLCCVLLMWSVVLLWYRLQLAAEEREDVDNQLASLQETLIEERRKAEVNQIESNQEKEAEAINESLDRITVKDGTKIHLIELADLLCIQSCGDYVTLITPKGEYIKEQTMKYFETHLPEADFIRIHRSAIVQVKQISRLELFGKESYQLILKNGLRLKVSNSGYRLLKERLAL
ncbi:MAG: LytTR family transcriptional regulator [Bacteroides sp.]|nr:LytTR family transcriptional regulator [Bacteroides sp.]